MSFIETLKLALRGVWAHKLRSALTLVGMVIGIAAVVLVVSLIQGFNRYVEEKIAAIGAKYFTIGRFGLEDLINVKRLEAALRRNKDLTLEDYDYLRAHATLTAQLGAKASPTSTEIKCGIKLVERVSVEGATSNVADIQNTEIADGRYFTEIENETGKRVVVIGADVAQQLFPTSMAIGQEVSIAGLPYRVIGVAAAKGTVFGVPQDLFATLPLKTYAKDFGVLIDRRALYFIGGATSDQYFDDAVREMRQLLRLRRGLSIRDKDNFGIITPDSITGLRDRLLSPIYLVAVAVPSIALLVAGIVIMNTMLVTVAERTKEIGLHRTVGARRADILKQVLVESCALAIIGGALGVVTAWVTGRFITAMFFPTHLSVTTIVTAVAVSSLIGIISGSLPARKAARLDPVEALRVE
ncbi:MAG: ABC transporter permease [Pyrinomonadaceae bacterium]